MTQPQRRRPGNSSPIKLMPEVEAVQTPPPAPEIQANPVVAHPVATPPTARSEHRRSTTTPGSSSQEAPATPASHIPADDPKVSVTVTLRRSVKKTAETAVLRTGGFHDGYSSFSALVENAVQLELQRLAAAYNGGVPFEQNGGSFRQGRPLGS